MPQGTVTAYLVQLLAKQVDENGLVVWYDPEHAYGAATGTMKKSLRRKPITNSPHCLALPSRFSHRYTQIYPDIPRSNHLKNQIPASSVSIRVHQWLKTFRKLLSRHILLTDLFAALKQQTPSSLSSVSVAHISNDFRLRHDCELELQAYCLFPENP